MFYRTPLLEKRKNSKKNSKGLKLICLQRSNHPTRHESLNEKIGGINIKIKHNTLVFQYLD